MAPKKQNPSAGPREKGQGDDDKLEATLFKAANKMLGASILGNPDGVH